MLLLQIVTILAPKITLRACWLGHDIERAGERIGSLHVINGLKIYGLKIKDYRLRIKD